MIPKPDSNTTNVKVKPQTALKKKIPTVYSNTTNVKVKPRNTNNNRCYKHEIQIQPMLRLNNKTSRTTDTTCKIQIQPMLRLNSRRSKNHMRDRQIQIQPMLRLNIEKGSTAYEIERIFKYNQC